MFVQIGICIFYSQEKISFFWQFLSNKKLEAFTTLRPKKLNLRNRSWFSMKL